MAKSADARDLKSLGGDTVPVQVRSPAPWKKHLRLQMLFSVKFVPSERVKYLRCEILLRKCEIRLRRVENEFYFTLRRRSNISRLPQGKHFTSLVGGIFHRSYIYKNASKRFLDIVEAISSIFAEDCKCFFGEIRSFGTSEISLVWNIALQMWNTPAACGERSWKTIIRFAKNIEC